MELKEIESAIEGILFAAGEPVGVERICLALEIDKATADAVCKRLADYYSYERRGIRLLRMENSYQLCSAPEVAAPIRRALRAASQPACPSLRWRCLPSSPITSPLRGLMWTRCAAWIAPTRWDCCWSGS